MAEGVRIVPGDGGPAIELTAANVRCPSYVATNTFLKDSITKSNIQRDFPIKTISGANVFTIPDTVVHIDIPPGTGLQQNVVFLDVLQTTNTNVRARYSGNYVVKQWVNQLGKFRTYQILPGTATQGFAANNARYGIKLSNGSTNFLEISSAATVGQCIWKSTQQAGNSSGWITFGKGGFTIPAVSGFDRNRYLVFVHWNDANISMDYDPNTWHLSAWTKSGLDTTETGAKVQIVVFCDGAAVPAHNGGLTIRNAANQVTFSSARAPFLLKGFISTNGGTAPAGTSRMMVPVIRTGINVDQYGGWYHYSYRGLTMSGTKLGWARSRTVGTDTDQYGSVINKPGINVPISLPVIDAANYM